MLDSFALFIVLLSLGILMLIKFAAKHPQTTGTAAKALFNKFGK